MSTIRDRVFRPLVASVASLALLTAVTAFGMTPRNAPPAPRAAAPVVAGGFTLLGRYSEDELAESQLDVIFDPDAGVVEPAELAAEDDGAVLVASLPAVQQDMVTEAIREWAGEDDVSAYVARYDETWLAWSGDDYLRIDGPELGIEFVVQPEVGLAGLTVRRASEAQA